VFSTEIGVTFEGGSPFYRFVKANRKVRATQGIALPNGKALQTSVWGDRQCHRKRNRHFRVVRVKKWGKSPLISERFEVGTNLAGWKVK